MAERLPEPRPELVGLAPAVHGGDAPPGIADLSTGVSPLSPPASIRAAIAAADLTRYPHPTALPLRQAVARRFQVEADCVVAGAGSVELIWALARAFGGPGRKVAYVAPAFSEYAQAARASGATVAAVSSLADACVGAADLTFVARPGNPLGDEPALRPTAARLLVVDEAYRPLVGGEAAAPSDRVAILRSLTKVFALPGLRVGYLIASRPVAAAVQATLPPWNVSQPAIAAGVEALAEPIAPVVAEIDRLRARLVARLDRLGARLVAARGTFVVVAVADAAAVTAQLGAGGVRVRDCTSFGLPQAIRIGVAADEAQERLVAAWSTVAARTVHG